MPSGWEIPLCTNLMLFQITMGFHTAGLVQGLWVFLGFLVLLEERDPGKGEQVIRDFSEGLKEELENWNRDKTAFSVVQGHLFP